MKKLKDLGNMEVIHVPNKEDIPILEKLYIKVFGKEYSNAMLTQWNVYKRETCFRITKGQYCDKDYFRKEKYIIYSLNDIEEWVNQEKTKMYSLKNLPSDVVIYTRTYDIYKILKKIGNYFGDFWETRKEKSCFRPNSTYHIDEPNIKDFIFIEPEQVTEYVEYLKEKKRGPVYKKGDVIVRLKETRVGHRHKVGRMYKVYKDTDFTSTCVDYSAGCSLAFKNVRKATLEEAIHFDTGEMFIKGALEEPNFKKRPKLIRGKYYVVVACKTNLLFIEEVVQAGGDFWKEDPDYIRHNDNPYGFMTKNSPNGDGFNSKNHIQEYRRATQKEIDEAEYIKAYAEYKILHTWEKFKEDDYVVVTEFDGEDKWTSHWFNPKEVLKLGGEYWSGSLKKHFAAKSLSYPKGNGMTRSFEANYKIRPATLVEIANSQWNKSKELTLDQLEKGKWYTCKDWQTNSIAQFARTAGDGNFQYIQAFIKERKILDNIPKEWHVGNAYTFTEVLSPDFLNETPLSPEKCYIKKDSEEEYFPKVKTKVQNKKINYFVETENVSIKTKVKSNKFNIFNNLNLIKDE